MLFHGWQSRMIVIGSAVLLVFFAVSLSKELIRRYEINKEVSKLKAEVEALEIRNKELADLIQLYNSPSYQEQQARAKLNLRKPGESVIAIPEEELKMANERAIEEQKKQERPRSNPEKWKDYFFKSRL
jgi:cell division protein FtsB